MKIGINASFIRKLGTGIGQVSLNFIKELAKTNTSDTFFLYLEEPLKEKLDLPTNFKIRVFLPAWKRDDLIRKVWWEKFLLPTQAQKDKCEVFISLYQSPTILPENIFHMMIVHDIIPEIFPEYLNNQRKKIYQKLTNSAIKSANKIISVSKRTEKDLIQRMGIDPKKITVNYPDVDALYKKNVSEKKEREVLKKYNLSPGYILAGGGLEKRKNIEGIFRAYQKLLEKNKLLSFTSKLPILVVWGKLLPKLEPLVTDAEKLVKKLNLSQKVRLLDFVPQEDLPTLYKNALVFVYPSLYEGFGLPILEAMNLGTPVICSKGSSLPEVGEDGVLYCDPEDTDDIAMVIKNILVNKELKKTLSVKGKLQSEKFSWEKFSQKMLNISKNTNGI